MATNIIFTRGNTATINATAITDGQILYNTTEGTQYLDNGTTRLQVGQNITVDAMLNSSSNNPIANSGVAGVMHTSLSEISTITQAGNLPDALAVKELNSNLNDYIDGIDVRYNTSLSRAEWSIRGADTWNPFSKMPPQMYTSTIDGSSSFIPSVKWNNNEFTISLYSTYYVAFDVRNFTKMKINAFSSYNSYTSALFSDTVLNTTKSTSNTLIRTFLTAITTPIEIDISGYDFITLCTYGSGSVRYSGYGGLFTGVSFE